MHLSNSFWRATVKNNIRSGDFKFNCDACARVVDVTVVLKVLTGMIYFLAWGIAWISSSISG